VSRSFTTKRYIEVVERLAAQLGRAHGWRRRAAERLGISESHLSKILSGERDVGRELAERAVERLGLDPSHFSEGATGERRAAASSVPIGGAEIKRLLKKVDAGKASVADVYALARAIAEAPAVAQAQAILKRLEPRTEKDVAALFIAAAKLASAIAKPARKKRK
jgi:transcriptional regulator with XRE-family HTH domain